jgi:hypothetical protein
LKRSPKGRQIIGLGVFSLLLTVSIVFLTGLAYIKDLTKGFASASSSNSILLSEKDVFSVLYISVDDIEDRPLLINNAQMTFFDRKSGKVLGYRISGNTVIDVPGRFGEEEFSKIIALGSLREPQDLGGGLELAGRTILGLFGYNADRYVMVDGDMSGYFDDLFSGGNSPGLISFKNVKKLSNSLLTDMTFGELYEVYQILHTSSEGRYSAKNFDHSYIQNPGLFDNEIRNITLESDIAKERKSISVLNGAGIPGLATFGARVVVNMGGRVTTAGNASRIYDESYLIVDDLDSFTVRQIATTFGVSNVILKINAGDIQENEINRTDIVFIMGVDINGSL